MSRIIKSYAGLQPSALKDAIMTIRRRIQLGYLLISLIILLLGAISFYRDIDQAEDIARHEVIAVAQEVAFLITDHLQAAGSTELSLHAWEIQTYIPRFKKIQDRNIVVLDVNKKIIADAVPAEIGRTFTHDKNGEVGLTLSDGKTRTFKELSSSYPDGIKQAVIPLKLDNGSLLGALVLEYTPLYKEIVSNARKSAINFLFFFLMALAISIITGYLIANKISMPLKNLADASEKIAAGDLNAKVQYKSPDEIGTLADSFNAMAEKLNLSMCRLVLYNKELEAEISERKSAEKSLHKANNLIRSLIDAIPDIVIFKDTEGRHLIANKAFEEFTGMKEIDALGKTDHDILPSDLAESCRRSDEEAMRGVDPICLDETTVRDGKKIYFGTTKVPVFDDMGKCSGIVGIARNITDHKYILQELRESETKLRTLFDSANDAIFVLDLEGNFIDINRTAHERLGYTKDEMLSMHISRLDPPEFAARVPERFEKIIKHGYAVFESAHYRKDGTIMPVEVNTRTIDYGGRKVIFSLIRDITERKLAENTIVAALKEKEVLLKEIHHRVKNNMQIIASMLRLQAEYIKDKESRLIFEESRKRIEAISLIHEKLYRSRDLAEIDFREYVTELTAGLISLYPFAPDQVELNIEMDNIIFDVTSSIPCGLIITELVSNAAKHAFPDGRKGTITLSMKRPDEKCIMLAVKDDGVGLPETIDFRNTQSLGLQLVIALVDQLGGTIETTGNRGTEFRIKFDAWRY